MTAIASLVIKGFECSPINFPENIRKSYGIMARMRNLPTSPKT